MRARAHLYVLYREEDECYMRVVQNNARNTSLHACKHLNETNKE